MIRATYLFGFGFLVFVSFFAVSAPASIIPRITTLPDGVSYSSIEGTLWNMTLRDTHWGTFSLGDISVSSSPLALLTGSATGSFHLERKGFTGSGLVSVSEILSLDDFQFGLNAEFGLGGTSLPVTIKIHGQKLEWNKQGQCLTARARLVTNAPAIVFAGFQNDIADTAANITCDNGRLRVSFSQDIGLANLSGAGVILGEDVLNLALVLRFPDQTAISEVAAAFMREYGFKQQPDGWHSKVTLSR